MIAIRFPDQSVREYASGITVLEVAQSISEGLVELGAIALTIGNKHLISFLDCCVHTKASAERRFKWKQNSNRTCFLKFWFMCVLTGILGMIKCGAS